MLARICKRAAARVAVLLGGSIAGIFPHVRSSLELEKAERESGLRASFNLTGEVAT